MKGKKFNKIDFLVGLFTLIVVGYMFLVWAGNFDTTVTPTSVNEDVSNLYNITIINTNVTTNTSITQVNITMPSGFTFTSGTDGSSVSGATFSNTSSVLTWNKTNNLVLNGTTEYFWFNATAITPGTFNFSVTTFDNFSVSESNESNDVTVNDTTAPTPTNLVLSSATKTSLTLTFSGAEGTCTVDRSGASVSGNTITETGLSCGTSYSYTVTCIDSASNSGVISATSFLTNSCGGTGFTTPLPKKSSSFDKITPGAAQIIKNFDPEIGIKEIKIEVNNEAQNVEITVTKFDGRPAEVSKSESGKVYQYLEIDVKNLGTSLDKATITVKVEKSWVSSNGVDRNDVVVSKFDEGLEVWNELTTTYTNEDDTYYYYDVEVDSFSFFAISAKVVVDERTEEPPITLTGGKGLTGLITILIIAGLIVIAWVWYSKNKK